MNIDQQGKLLVTYDDGSTKSVGSVVGAPGQDGKPGTVNVVVMDDDEVVGNHRELKSGSTVKVNVKRFVEPVGQ